ncbi:cytochrome P450 [Melanomma pulvis-pyrius CBS 109.77]|uniref:Cytochrome P450 n=1 Tax=Melanomma pulvis-pyrius CBS 109.77 TaxID=1314802 RepID=A0A6A6XR06_9PLEO|nr:cytochrome P450 [Melanomma pulvis-pyrius CBS 109.77]
MALTIICILLFTTATVVAYSKLKPKQFGETLPTAPYLFPVFAHTATFAAGDEKLASALKRYAVSEAPIRFRGIGFNFVLLSGKDIIRKALSTANLDWNKISAPLFGGMFGGSEAIVHALQHDNSGIGAKPYPGSNVHPGRRLLRNQILFFSDAFSRGSLDELVPRFVKNLQDWCAESSSVVGSDWVEKPDLYEFVRDILFSCSVDSFFGKNLRQLNPNLDKDFWEYDDNISFLATPMPRWLRPNAIKARDRCHDSMKRWREHAVNESKSLSLQVPEDASWDPVWGLGAIRRRNKLFDATGGLLDKQNRASTDLALLWALTSNVIPASFWYLFEVLASDGLLDRTRMEIAHILGGLNAINEHKFSPADLTNSDLLQSIYAETLRLHVIALITRSVKKEHHIGKWLFPKDQAIIVSSHVEHMNEQWDTSDEKHPCTAFSPDRFLTHEKNESGERRTKFSLDGRQGQWIPFGLGEHMCPGRHFAKQEMIINFAVLISTFDFELLTPKNWRPEDNLSRYGFGTQQPKQKTPFRIRKRAVK